MPHSGRTAAPTVERGGILGAAGAAEGAGSTADADSAVVGGVADAVAAPEGAARANKIEAARQSAGAGPADTEPGAVQVASEYPAHMTDGHNRHSHAASWRQTGAEDTRASAGGATPCFPSEDCAADAPANVASCEGGPVQGSRMPGAICAVVITVDRRCTAEGSDE